jgi:amino acid permease
MPNLPETTPTKKKAAEPVGYSQELKRTLGPAQVFAVSFAFISVAVGIFGTYDDVLRNAGPIGIWLWVIPTVGQTLVALVIAQFAAPISLAGSCYQWASRLANPRVGWGFGWVSFCYLAVGVVAVDNALASMAFMPLVGLEPNEEVARVITVVVLLVQAVLAVASTRIRRNAECMRGGRRSGDHRGAAISRGSGAIKFLSWGRSAVAPLIFSRKIRPRQVALSWAT